MPFDVTQTETLAVSQDGPIAEVALNRPDKMNAMNAAFWKELPQVIDALSAQTDVRVIILSGRGKHFTSGLDLSDPSLMSTIGDDAKVDPGRLRYRLRQRILRMQDSFTALERCRVPVIAAVHGACIGGGVDLITACDLRYATSDAYICIQEINIGMVADVGTLQRAPHLMPQGILRELAYTGRRMGAEEAAGHGLFNGVLPDQDTLLAKAREVATEIASKSPLAIAGTKEVLAHARDHSVAEGLDYIATWNSGMLLTQDLMKGAQAAMMRQTATFDPLLADD